MTLKECGRPRARSLSEEVELRPVAAAPFTADDVRIVEVTAPGGAEPAYTVVREGERWIVTKPFRAPASGATVRSFNEAIARAEGELRAESAAALEEFHLTPDRATTVTLRGDGDKVLAHFALGRTAGTRGTFVRLLGDGQDEDAAYEVTNDLRGLVGLRQTQAGEVTPETPEAGFFHDKSVPQFDATKAKSVALAAPGRRLDLVKEGAAWKVGEGGPTWTLKKEGVDEMLRHLGGGLRPQALVDPAKRAELGFDAPTHRLEVAFEDGATRTVVGVAPTEGDKHYVRLDAEQDPDVLWEVASYEFGRVFPRGQTFFDLPKADAPEEGVGRIVVERTADPWQRIEIARTGTRAQDDWTLVAPKWPLEPRQSALRSLGGLVTTVRAVDYVDATTLDAPTTVVRYGAPGVADDAMSEIRIGDAAPGTKDRLATFSGAAPGGRVVVVAESTADRLAPKPLDLFEPKLFSGWTEADVTVVRVDGGPVVTRTGATWSLAKPGVAEPATARTQAALDWLDALLALEARSMAPAAEAKDGVTVTVERKRGTPRTIVVFPAKDGKRAVEVAGVMAEVDDAAGLLPEASNLEAAPAAPEKSEEPKDEDDSDEEDVDEE